MHGHATKRRKPSAGGDRIGGQSCSRPPNGDRATRDRATRDRATRAGATGHPPTADGRDEPGRPRTTRRTRGTNRPRGAARAQGRHEYRSLQLRRRHHRQHEREHRALAAHLVLEGSATWATLDVGTRPAAGQDLAADVCDQLARGRTGTVARVATTDQAFTRLEDECLHLLPADAQHRRDLGVGLASKLEKNQRGAVIGREAVHVVDHLAEVLASTERIGGVEVPAIGHRVVDGDRFLARPELR